MLATPWIEAIGEPSDPPETLADLGCHHVLARSREPAGKFGAEPLAIDHEKTGAASGAFRATLCRLSGRERSRLFPYR